MSWKHKAWLVLYILSGNQWHQLQDDNRTGADEAIDLILGQIPHILSIHLQDFIPDADEPGKVSPIGKSWDEYTWNTK